MRPVSTEHGSALLIILLIMFLAQRAKSQGFGDSVPKEPGQARDLLIAACTFITDTNSKEGEPFHD